MYGLLNDTAKLASFQKEGQYLILEFLQEHLGQYPGYPRVLPLIFADKRKSPLQWQELLFHIHLV